MRWSRRTSAPEGDGPGGRDWYGSGQPGAVGGEVLGAESTPDRVRQVLVVGSGRGDEAPRRNHVDVARSGA